MQKNERNMKTPIAFVSLGPGDAEEVTLKALHCLESVDMIFCPCTVTPSGKQISRSAAVVQQLGIQKDKIELFEVPMNPDRTLAQKAYELTFHRIKEAYDSGSQIAVTVEGDASIYASIHYMMDLLTASGVEVNQLAGVPSFIAAAALAKLQLVELEERLVVIPGNVDIEELKVLIENGHTLVIMKLSRCAEQIHDLIRQLPALRYFYFENIGHPDKEICITDVHELLEKDFPYFSLLIVQSSGHISEWHPVAGNNDIHEKPTLTQTEIEILRLIAKGKSVKEIAAIRFSSIHTITTHKKNIFRKIHVNSVYEATRYAFRAGIAEMLEYYI